MNLETDFDPGRSVCVSPFDGIAWWILFTEIG